MSKDAKIYLLLFWNLVLLGVVVSLAIWCGRLQQKFEHTNKQLNECYFRELEINEQYE